MLSRDTLLGYNILRCELTREIRDVIRVFAVVATVPEPTADVIAFVPRM